MIRNEQGKFNVYSEDGTKHLGGPYDSLREARRRLRQVEYFKAKGKQDE